MKVRSWYGLTGEIEVENELWHLVKIGHVTLNHPPVINLILRRGLPREDRLRLSYRHEFGHFQTLPIALAHVFLMLWIGREQRRTRFGWLKWLATLAVAHEAVWELTSEAYVVVHDGVAYRATHRQTPNRLVPMFWIVMIGLGLGLSRWLVQKQ
ncbi:hypothetical protein PLCT2_01109 [Planctomycetaceae bacterium]|nr:hypothetical protein PLCT2_01109 [Planctomycetaceae bacterium]